MEHGDNNGHSHHAMMLEDFRKRFFVSVVLTLPVLFLSPIIRQALESAGGACRRLQVPLICSLPFPH